MQIHIDVDFTSGPNEVAVAEVVLVIIVVRLSVKVNEEAVEDMSTYVNQRNDEWHPLVSHNSGSGLAFYGQNFTGSTPAVLIFPLWFAPYVHLTANGEQFWRVLVAEVEQPVPVCLEPQIEGPPVLPLSVTYTWTLRCPA